MCRSEPISLAVATAVSRAASRSSSLTHTTGHTSSAPTHGCAPSCFRMSIQLTHDQAPLTRGVTISPGGALSVTTLRLCRASEWMSRSAAPVAKAPEISSIRRRSRPSEKFGTARSIAGASRLDEELAVADELLAVHAQRGLHHDAVQMDGYLNLAADPGRRAERHVDRPEDLLVLKELPRQCRLFVRPHAQLSDAGSVGPGSLELAHQLLPHLSSPADERPVLDCEFDGLVGNADRGERPVDEQRATSRVVARGDEPLTAWQIPERTGFHQLAVVGDRLAPLDDQDEVRAVRAGDARLAAGIEDVGHRVAPAAQLGHVGAHHAGEHLLGRPGQGRRPGAAVGRRLTRRGVREGLDRRHEQNVRPDHRSRYRVRRLNAMLASLGELREYRLTLGALSLLAKPLRQRPGRRIANDDHVLAGFDHQTLVDDGLDGPLQIAHRAGA